MRICTLELTVGLALVALLAACGPRGETSLLPDRAAPGATVLVRLERATLEDELSTGVEIGGKAATIVRISSPTELEVLVPDLDPGPAEVMVRVERKVVGTQTLTVEPAAFQRLVLALEGDRIELVASQRASSGQREPAAPYSIALSYDVLTAEGALVSTGTIPHPVRGRREVYELPEGRLRGAPEPVRGTFTLKIPAVPAGSVVRFYEVDADVDLTTEAGRGARRLVDEIEIGG